MKHPKKTNCYNNKKKPKNCLKSSPNNQNQFGSNSISKQHALCTTLLQSIIFHLFQLQIVNHLKHWIFLLPKLQNYKWLAPRNSWEIVLILSQSWHHCIAMDLKIRTSKNLSFFLRSSRILYFFFFFFFLFLDHHRILKKKLKDFFFSLVSP